MTPILGSELLQGELVYLNRVVRDDIPLIAVQWADVGFLRHMSRRPAYPPTTDGLTSWLVAANDDHAEPTFAIRLREDDRLIGVCAFKDIRWESRHSYFWIGIGDAAMRGRGYGADATRVLLKYAFLEMNLHCVGLEVFAYNAPAMAMYTKIGFQYDGLTRAYLYRDGVYYDMHFMSMLRDEWEARYGDDARRSVAG